jgi:hypothetical protein
MSAHPLIKQTIQNLDLDLGLELNQYEYSVSKESALTHHLFTYDNSFDREPADADDDEPIIYQSAVIEDEEDIIPVASRLIDEPTSLWDQILSPWGIFGIIIFVGANLLILFNNWDTTSTVNNSVNNNQASLKTNSNSSESVNTNNQFPSTTQNLPSSGNSSTSGTATTNNENASPYPDLKTALFSEIEQPQLPVAPSNQVVNPPVQPIPNNSNNDVAPNLKNYYLLSNYTNMNEFTTIKNIIPLAAIVNVGDQRKIQLAVFDNENEAKTKSQQLKNNGINNYIYSP